MWEAVPSLVIQIHNQVVANSLTKLHITTKGGELFILQSTKTHGTLHQLRDWLILFLMPVTISKIVVIKPFLINDESPEMDNVHQV